MPISQRFTGVESRDSRLECLSSFPPGTAAVSIMYAAGVGSAARESGAKSCGFKIAVDSSYPKMIGGCPEPTAVTRATKIAQIPPRSCVQCNSKRTVIACWNLLLLHFTKFNTNTDAIAT